MADVVNCKGTVRADEPEAGQTELISQVVAGTGWLPLE